MERKVELKTSYKSKMVKKFQPGQCILLGNFDYSLFKDNAVKNQPIASTTKRAIQ